MLCKFVDGGFTKPKKPNTDGLANFLALFFLSIIIDYYTGLAAGFCL